MSVGSVRPSITELSLSVFERALHPELFSCRRRQRLVQPHYSATLQICDAGHLIELGTPAGLTVTEVLAHRAHQLPERRLVIHRKVKGGRDEVLKIGNAVRLSLSFEVERLTPEQFLTLHEELQEDCRLAPVGFRFETSNRLSPAPLSFLQTDVWETSLLIHSFHTFPSDCAIVKTQSLFEL